MNTRTPAFTIALVVILIVLSPSLGSIKFVTASTHYCTEYAGKSQNWINGCQQGWWDHNHCWGYNPGSGDYAKGYKVGWIKGQCK